jgi:hypothetical protein
MSWFTDICQLVSVRSCFKHRLAWKGLLILALWLKPSAGQSQIDPERRRLFQLGYAMPLSEHGPLAAYGYYYHNQPGFYKTNLTLRLAVAPVYLDSELGIREALGPDTDLGVGLAGGGFADSYSEVRRGDYLTDESFTGHSADFNSSLYHRFNPTQRMPLYGIVRGSFHYSVYENDKDTARTFQIPENRPAFSIRSGLRLGGREPYLTPSLAAELSAWYEGQFRLRSGSYGFDGDREVNPNSHSFWGRALLAYTFEQSKQHFEASLTAGTVLNADRFSAYRLGGSLPLIAEFPLTLPGYHRQEISADNFFQLSGSYLFPLDPDKRLSLTAYGALATVDYLKDLSQPGHFHSGVGGGILYRTRSNAWQIGMAYAYGFEAIREEGRGGQTITLVLQYDLDAAARAGRNPFWNPLVSADTWRGVFRIFTGR